MSLKDTEFTMDIHEADQVDFSSRAILGDANDQAARNIGEKELAAPGLADKRKRDDKIDDAYEFYSCSSDSETLNSPKSACVQPLQRPVSLNRPSSASSFKVRQELLISRIKTIEADIENYKNLELDIKRRIMMLDEKLSQYNGVSDDPCRIILNERLASLEAESFSIPSKIQEAENKIFGLQEALYTISKHPKDDMGGASLLMQCENPSFTCISSAIETPDGFLEFSHPYPAKKGLHDRLFIRKCYREIFSQIQITQEGRKFPVCERYMIQGTPGVGKSSFLLYAFVRLVQMKKKVLYACSGYQVYFDGISFWECLGNIFQRGQKTPAGMDFWTHDLFCLFDADNQKRMPTTYFFCQFILATSPKRDLVNDFKKTVSYKDRFFMPVWSLSEMERIQVLYNPPSDWRVVFDLLGGVPRIIFENSCTYNEAHTMLQDALSNFDFTTISSLTTRSMIHLSNNVKSYAHLLVHIHSDPPYSRASLTFASRVALSLVFSYHLNQVKARWYEVLHSDVGGALDGAFIGDLFEIVAVDLLLAGGEFNHCRLRINKEPEDLGKLILPKSVIRRKESVEDSGDPNVLYVPISPSFPGLDAWMYEVGGYQVTINLRHDMNERLITDLPKLGAGAHKLFWVLRSHEYKRFKARKHMTKDFNYPELEQYAIEMPDSMISMVDRALEQIRQRYEPPRSNED